MVGADTAPFVCTYHRIDGVWQPAGSIFDPTPREYARFGFSIAISGATAIIGAPFSVDAAAYIFQRVDDTWNLVARLTPYSSPLYGEFGYTVAIEGDRAAIISPTFPEHIGAVHVYERINGTWTRTAVLISSDYRWLGRAVALSGDTIVTGAEEGYGENEYGACYIFERRPGGWEQTAHLIRPASAGYYFGYSVSLSGDRLVVGSQLGPLVYERASGAWSLVAALTPSEGERFFAPESTISGDTILVGAPNDYPSAAYVFRRLDGVWTRMFEMWPFEGAFWFGSAVAISGETYLVGARGEGAAYVFDTRGAPPAFIAQPPSGAAVEGWRVRFPITVRGSRPFSYQWRRDGVPIAHGGPFAIDEDGTLIIDPAAVGLAGDYDVVVDNGCGVVTSEPASLTVVPAEPCAPWEMGSSAGSFARARDLGGAAVALGHDLAAFGGPGAWNYDRYGELAVPESGSAYILERRDGQWSETFRYRPRMTTAYEGRVGNSVSVETDVVLAGAPGEPYGFEWGVGIVHVFERSGSTWIERPSLGAADRSPGDSFGFSVSLSGSSAFIGAPGDDDHGLQSGSAYVFTRAGSGWAQSSKVAATGEVAGQRFGAAVALQAGRAVIGAPHDETDMPGAGAAYVFEPDGGGWGQVAVLQPVGGAADDLFGLAVALHDDLAVVGAPHNDEHGADAGAAYVFERSGDAWICTGVLAASDSVSGAAFGCSVAAGEGRILVGAMSDSERAEGAGAVYLFERADGAWAQTRKMVAHDGRSNDGMGSAVAVWENQVMAGAPMGGVSDDSYGGAVYHFDLLGRANVNRDDRVDANDFFHFLTQLLGDPPGTAADFNRDGTVNSQDFFDFLFVFFAQC